MPCERDDRLDAVLATGQALAAALEAHLAALRAAAGVETKPPVADKQSLHLGRWLAGRCVDAPDAETRAIALYDDYVLWSRVAGEKPMTNTAFGRRLTALYRKRHTAAGGVYDGVRLR